MIKRLNIQLLTLLLISLVPHLHAQELTHGHYAASKPYDLFDHDEILYIFMKSDFDSINNDRGEDRRYHEGRLWYMNEQCEKIELNVRLRTRGNFRRKPEHCSFPPLRIRFNINQVENTIFHGQKKLKIVTHCEADKYVLKEYLIYKMYNVLTDKSYRVRLSLMHYIDTVRQDTLVNYAFFLENSKLMAKRIGGKQVKNQEMTKNNMNLHYNTLLYLFQYMIGNSDWDIYLQKNLRFLDLSWYDKIIPIPYDFDWAEIVDAPYTRVDAYVGLKPIEKRKMKSIDRNEDEYKFAFEYFLSKKEEIIKTVCDFPYLPYNESVALIEYLEDFFKEIEKPLIGKEKFFKIQEKESKNK